MAPRPDQDGGAGVADEVAHGLQGSVRAGRGGAFSRPVIHRGEEVDAGERLLALLPGGGVWAAGGGTIMKRVEVRDARRGGRRTLRAQRGEGVRGGLQENGSAFKLLCERRKLKVMSTYMDQ